SLCPCLYLCAAVASCSPSTNSMFVTCRISLLERLLFAPRNPCTFIELPNGSPLNSFACVSNAMAATSAWMLRLPPASSCSDSCPSLNSTAATPAGVWRSAPSSSSRPLSSSRFRRRLAWPAAFRAALAHHRLRLLLAHHRRGRGVRLGHADDQVAQHGVAELERVLELLQRLVVALDVHEHVVRLVHLGDRVGELPAAPVLEAMHGAVALGDQALVALDHLRDLLALVGMNDENDFVMPHVRLAPIPMGLACRHA